MDFPPDSHDIQDVWPRFDAFENKVKENNLEIKALKKNVKIMREENIDLKKEIKEILQM